LESRKSTSPADVVEWSTVFCMWQIRAHRGPGSQAKIDFSGAVSPDSRRRKRTTLLSSLERQDLRVSCSRGVHAVVWKLGVQVLARSADGAEAVQFLEFRSDSQIQELSSKFSLRKPLLCRPSTRSACFFARMHSTSSYRDVKRMKEDGQCRRRVSALRKDGILLREKGPMRS